MSQVIQLVANNGSLFFPAGGDDVFEGVFDSPDLPSLLLCRYAAGDCDTIPWPMVSEFASAERLQARLASALYDEREMNQCFPVDAQIALPDGQIFNFDQLVA